MKCGIFSGENEIERNKKVNRKINKWQDAQKCKKMSKFEKQEFSTYPHSKYEKTWKTRHFRKVIHIIHTQTGVFCELLLWKKERMFCKVVMKLLVCRKRKKNILTFEYSKSSKNRRNNSENSSKIRLILKRIFRFWWLII